MGQKSNKLAEKLRRQVAGPMSAAEIEFCQDMQAFIEFAIRNGLSLGVVASVIGHDINELARNTFNWEQAQSHGFKPKVSGYGKIVEEDFGEVTEEEDEVQQNRPAIP